MLELCWEIISICGNFLIDWEGSYIIMASLMLSTAFVMVYSILIKGL